MKTFSVPWDRLINPAGARVKVINSRAMTHSKQEIINAIKKLVSDNGGDYTDFYVGIAADPKDRLFNDHNVSESTGVYDCWEAYDDEDTRDVEKYCIENLGTEGGTGGGDEDSDTVYAYKITPSTKE